MNVDELYKYIGERTGMRQFHISFAEGKTEFNEKEVEEIAECVESVCKMQKAHKAAKSK